MEDKTKKQIAIKLVNLDEFEENFGEKEKKVRMYRNKLEVEIMRKCDCQYIIRYNNAFENPRYQVTIMEYFPGPTLLTEIQENQKKYREEDAVIAIKQIILAFNVS